jgi:hypothetical protein
MVNTDEVEICVSRQQILQEGRSFMQDVSITLSRNEREQNWTVTINGKSYEFISIEAVKEHVSRAVAIAERAMTDRSSRRQE